MSQKEKKHEYCGKENDGKELEPSPDFGTEVQK